VIYIQLIKTPHEKVMVWRMIQYNLLLLAIYPLQANQAERLYIKIRKNILMV
jgi:hypothetical protein